MYLLDCLVVIEKKTFFVNYLALMKKTGSIRYDGSLIYNLKGMGFQRDSDWDKPGSPSPVGIGGYDLDQSYFDDESSICVNLVFGDEKNY